MCDESFSKKNNFIIPSMIGILSVLTLARKLIESKKVIQKEANTNASSS